MVNLQQLRYLVEVYREGHFGRAAKKCFVTQPTLSMQIQKLEEDLNVLIFDREASPITPTPLGKKIIEQAMVVLHEEKKIHSLINLQTQSLEGTIRLAVIPTIAPYLIPKVIGSFSKTLPKLEILIQELETSQIIDKMKKLEIDIAILATPLKEETIEEIKLYDEPFMAYLPKSKLNEKIKDLDLRDLLLLQDGHCFRNQILEFCHMSKNRNKNINAKFQAGNLETLIKLVDQDFGYTYLPFLKAIELGKTQKLQLKKLENPVPSREISIVHLKGYERTKLVGIFKDLILKSLRDEMVVMDKVKTKTMGVV